MQQLKPLFPLSFGGKTTHDLVVAVLAYLILGVLAGVVCWIVGIIPLIGGLVAWVLRAISGLYVLGGLVLLVLHHIGSV